MAKRILLLMDNRLDSNWGSQASTGMLVSLLRERFPDAEIQGIPRRMAGRRGCHRRLGERLLPKALLANRWTSLRARIGLHAVTVDWREHFDGVDLIVVNGEGTLHSQNQILRWMPIIAYLKEKTQVPLWIVNSSLQIEDPKHIALFRACLSKADRLVVREGESVEVARSLGLDPIPAADCAFLMTPGPEVRVDEILCKHGVTGKFAVMTGSAVSWTWSTEPGKALLAALRDRGLSVLFTSSENPDNEFHQRLDPTVPLVTHHDLDASELMTLQARSEVVVGGRFHPAILAACTGTPFVLAESNTHKMKGLMAQLETPELLNDYADIAAQIKTLNHVLDNRDYYRDHLRQRSGELRKLARLNVEFADQNSAAKPLISLR